MISFSNFNTYLVSHRNATILLDGYIEIHKQTCNKEDCPLKEKNQIKKRLLSQSRRGNKQKINEKKQLILQLVQKMYYYGIKKFPNNTSLRIQYAFFLEKQA